MNEVSRTGWLHRVDGASIAIPPRGLILGRRPDCDVVLNSARASQVHAVITPTLDGLELLSLGRNPSLIDGQPTQGRALLRDGASLALPGGTFAVQVAPTTNWSADVWSIHHPDGHRYALRRLPYVVGGGANDHLRVDTWPGCAVEFHAAGGALAMEFLAEGQLNQASMAMGAVESVRDGDRLAFGGVAVSVHIASDQASESTQLLSQDGARRAVFEFLPNGGQLTLTFRDGPAPFAVVLPELRARLMATLLQPPGGYTAGDLVPDDVLIPSVWPGQPHRDRTDMNVLIYRTRKSLLKAGLNPDRVLARARAGGSTRFRLAAGADVVVE